MPRHEIHRLVYKMLNIDDADEKRQEDASEDALTADGHEEVCYHCGRVMKDSDEFCANCRANELRVSEEQVPVVAVAPSDPATSETSDATAHSTQGQSGVFPEQRIAISVAIVVIPIILLIVTAGLNAKSRSVTENKPAAQISSSESVLDDSSSIVIPSPAATEQSSRLSSSYFSGDWTNHNDTMRLKIVVDGENVSGCYQRDDYDNRITGEKQSRAYVKIVAGKIYKNIMIVTFEGEDENAAVVSGADDRVVDFISLSPSYDIGGTFYHPESKTEAMALDPVEDTSPPVIPHIGDLGNLGGGPLVGDPVVTADAESLEKWNIACNANDNVGAEQVHLLDSFDVDVIRVLDVKQLSSGSIIKARVVTGRSKEQVVWVRADDFQLLYTKEQQIENMPGE